MQAVMRVATFDDPITLEGSARYYIIKKPVRLKK